MYKYIEIHTHGVMTFEGTIISCLARFNDQKDIVSKMIYNDKGVLILYESRHENIRKI